MVQMLEDYDQLKEKLSVYENTVKQLKEELSDKSQILENTRRELKSVKNDYQKLDISKEDVFKFTMSLENDIRDIIIVPEDEEQISKEVLKEEIRKIENEFKVKSEKLEEKYKINIEKISGGYKEKIDMLEKNMTLHLETINTQSDIITNLKEEIEKIESIK